MNKLIANYDKIIVKLADEGETKFGNIIIPDMGKERPDMGEIISVGPGFYTLSGTVVPCTLQIGQIVLIPKFGAQKITLDNDEYAVCKESDVLAIIEKIEVKEIVPISELLKETATDMNNVEKIDIGGLENPINNLGGII